MSSLLAKTVLVDHRITTLCLFSANCEFVVFGFCTKRTRNSGVSLFAQHTINLGIPQNDDAYVIRGLDEIHIRIDGHQRCWKPGHLWINN